jgi:rubredoxin
LDAYVRIDIDEREAGTHAVMERVALELTGMSTFDGNGLWHLTPPNWCCPLCKRSKIHLARPNRSGVLHGHLHEHHDHIREYVRDRYRSEFGDPDADDIRTGTAWSFINRFMHGLNRFDTIVVCQDCNVADGAAKLRLGTICNYFSFSPIEIANFVQPEPHKPHLVDDAMAASIYSAELAGHSERKSVMVTLLLEQITNGRLWGEAPIGASGRHYVAARTLLRSRELMHGDAILDLSELPLAGLRDFSKSLGKHERIRHKRLAKRGQRSDRQRKRDRSEA